MTRWWLSFADATRPAGSQFLGICIVRAVDMVSAIKVAHALGINPGGEVRGFVVDDAAAARLSFDLVPYEDRFIGGPDAKQLADRCSSELGE
jgi:hypothetical protein